MPVENLTKFNNLISYIQWRPSNVSCVDSRICYCYNVNISIKIVSNSLALLEIVL